MKKAGRFAAGLPERIGLKSGTEGGRRRGGFKISTTAAVACLFVAAVLCEVFIFNFRYFEELALGAPHRSVAAAELTGTGHTAKGPGGLSISPGATFYLNAPGVPVNSLRLYADGGPFTVSVSYKDEAASHVYTDAGSWTVDPSVPGSDRIRFISSGNCLSVRFFVTDAVGSPTITGIELNAPYFHFSLVRFLLLFLALLVLYRLRRPEAWLPGREGDESYRRDAVLFVFTAAAVLAVLLYGIYGDTESFSRTVDTDSDCYRLLTEAFAHGRLGFLANPPPALKALADPYDPSARANISYIFDSSYFGGKYYCYFGVAPVLTLLLPFRLLTGLYMPTSFACLLYFLLMLFALLSLYCRIVARWFPEVGPTAFVGGAVAAVFGANLFWLIARPTFYELAVICALFYLFAGFSLLLGPSKSRAPLFFSGLCFSLMVASRPSFVFYLAAALPLIFPIVFPKGKKPDFGAAAAFFAPLIAAAAGLMAYNAARFGSPFDFGERYQLTVSDIRFNRVSNLAALPGGIFHYFFAPLGVDLSFPFFHVAQSSPATSSGYYYNEPAAGLFNFPLLLILPGFIYIIKRFPKKSRGLGAFTALLICGALCAAYVDITLAGVLERYTLDFGPALMFAALMLWLEALEYFRSKGAYVPAAKLFFVVCIVTAVVSTLASCVGEGDIQLTSDPQAYEKISMLFEFWR